MRIEGITMLAEEFELIFKEYLGKAKNDVSYFIN